jgi:hypothetical protein
VSTYANREQALSQAISNGHRMGPWEKDSRSAHGWISRCRNAGCSAQLLLRDPAEEKPSFSGDADQGKCTGKRVV